MEKQESIEAQLALSKIQEKLESGMTATNKNAVKKRIKKNNSSEPMMELWSFWCTDGNNKFLAVLMPDGRVKLFTPEQLENKYTISCAK